MEALMAEGDAIALAPDAVKAELMSQRRPAEQRRSTGQGIAMPVPASTQASHRTDTLPHLAGFIGAHDAEAPEEPVEVEAPPILPQPARMAPAAESMARVEPVIETRAVTLDAAPPVLATPVAQDFRTGASRQPSAPNPALPRPHLPPEAGQQLALRVATAAANRVESVSVDLRPPELGRVELRLTFHDGTVQVSMAAERGDTFEALRQDRIHLEQQMQQAGLQLSSGGLDLQHGHLPREAPEPRPALPAHADGTEAAEDEAAPPRLPASDSLIDLIA
jgi:hypothetical protein